MAGMACSAKRFEYYYCCSRLPELRSGDLLERRGGADREGYLYKASNV